MKFHIRALAGLAFAAAFFAAAPASAQGTPVIDPSAIAKIRETISVGTKQLGAIQQQVQQVTQMRNTLGQIGPGMLGNILKESGLDFAGPEGILRDVSSMASQSKSMISEAGNLSVNGIMPKLPASITNLADGRNAAKSLFFYAGEKALDQTGITQLRERRNAVLRDAAINGYGAATSMKGDMVKSQQIADKLSTQAQSTTDLRGDVQANTATMLAIYGEITKQTAIQAQMLEVQSAQTLSVDSTAQSKGN